MNKDKVIKKVEQCFSGSKYHRNIVDLDGKNIGIVDVYSVLHAFDVSNPAIQHAVKKVLCAGLRNKGGF